MPTAWQKQKASKIMAEYKAGTLHSGSSEGPVVHNRKQAIAILLSETGQSNTKRRRHE